MAKYMCKCGEYLKRSKDSKPTIKTIHYKVFIVRTETLYKCPKGCELTDVIQIK